MIDKEDKIQEQKGHGTSYTTQNRGYFLIRQTVATSLTRQHTRKSKVKIEK
jgi:hypothetical protein